MGVKAAGCLRLTTLPQSCVLQRSLGTLTSWNTLGLSRPVMGLLYPFNCLAYADYNILHNISQYTMHISTYV